MDISGLAVFGLIKFIGYTLFLRVVMPGENPSRIYLAALVRLIAGMAVGMLIFSLFVTGRNIFPVYFTAILLGRLVIWYLIFQLFFRSLERDRKLKLTAGGTLISYLLDIPSFLGTWVAVGGIC